DLRGTPVLRVDGGWPLRAPSHAAECGTPLPGRRLPGPARAVRSLVCRDHARLVDREAGVHLAGTNHRLRWDSRVLPVATREPQSIARGFELEGPVYTSECLPSAPCTIASSGRTT